MKVAYIFKTNMASTFQLTSMILPQLEMGTHGVTVVGMFFFDDNVFALQDCCDLGRRLQIIATKDNILLMACDQCALRRGLAVGDFSMCGMGELTPKGMIPSAKVGCFPQLYEALSQNTPDHIITL